MEDLEQYQDTEGGDFWMNDGIGDDDDDDDQTEDVCPHKEVIEGLGDKLLIVKKNEFESEEAYYKEVLEVIRINSSEKFSNINSSIWFVKNNSPGVYIGVAVGVEFPKLGNNDKIFLVMKVVLLNGTIKYIPLIYSNDHNVLENTEKLSLISYEVKIEENDDRYNVFSNVSVLEDSFLWL